MNIRTPQMHRRQMLAIAVAFAALIFTGTRPAAAQTEVVIYSFQSTNGAYPYGRLISDKAGNLYGTTINGGTANQGTVYRLAPPSTAGGKWTESVLYNFQGGDDGGVPWGGLTFDSAGDLYGTAEHGGITGACVTRVARLTAELYFNLFPPLCRADRGPKTFCTNSMANTEIIRSPDNLIFDKEGNLFGPTDTGGTYQHDPYGGTVFRLSPPTVTGGKWTQTVIHSFGSGKDGINPIGKLLLDQAGNLYGTTEYGGTGTACGTFGGCGTVFRISRPTAQGQPWAETMLYNFQGVSDGGLARGGVILDKNGNIYGATLIGGAFNSGTVFEMTPQSGGWSETVLYSFTGDSDGYQPIDGVILGNSGALYGTTVFGNSSSGSVFKLSPPSSTNDNWTETTLYLFDNAPNGLNPWGNVLIGSGGKLLGTTANGGKANFGTVFEILP